MHYRFFVTFNKEHAATSSEARAYVSQCLEEEGFVSDGATRWSRGLADWFVIGGRWSGELSSHSWAASLYTRMEKAEKAAGVQVWGAHYSDKDKQRLQQELAVQFQEIWDNNAPPAYRGIPIQRDTYNEDGYEDDAMILTEELYAALLKDHAGEAESEEHADLEYDKVSPAMVGRKWLVVVDYHN